jgi:hypothetical protein
MVKKKIIALSLCLAASAVCVMGAFAQITVSASYSVSVGGVVEAVNGNIVSREEAGGGGQHNSEKGSSLLGGGFNLFADYLLPIPIPLSLGLEAGFNFAGFWLSESYDEEAIYAIPLLLRAAYHFDLHPKLDLYVVGKIGYVIGIWTGEYRDIAEKVGGTVEHIGSIGFGFDAGVAYYFNSKIGMFMEMGFDKYTLKPEISGDTAYSATFEVPLTRVVTAGISFKK